MKAWGRCAVIVAHPDDEVIWAGGTMLMHPEASWKVVTLCRASDTDRAPRFARVMERLGAQGQMGDLDDGPQQKPLAEELGERTIMGLLGEGEYDLVLTHGPKGEYTRHRRHEEVSRAVTRLWETHVLRAKELWRFAYEDGGGMYAPRAVASADRVLELPEHIWLEKRKLIQDTYGFAEGSFEVRSASRTEAFWTSARGQ